MKVKVTAGRKAKIGTRGIDKADNLGTMFRKYKSKGAGVPMRRGKK